MHAVPGTTVVRPADPEPAAALRVAGAFGCFKVALHVCLTLWVAHLGYGYFRDEMYYVMCGRHLAWGYVDHGPLVAMQARLAETLFGNSLVGLRLISAAAGGVRVFLTGILAWALGARRPGQVLAMIGVLAVPNYMGIDSFLSMNSCESMFWMTSLLALILMVRAEATGQERGDSGRERLWLLFGLSAGLGLLNKPSMTFFLAALLGALLVTPERRLLRTPWMLAGVGLMLAIVLPNLWWQVSHHWPTLEFLNNGRLRHKNVALGPLAFLGAQVRETHPLNCLIWVPGLLWLLRRARWRWLGLTYVFFLLIMMALHAKDYYVTPVYPVLFAAGGVMWESRRRLVPGRGEAGRLFAFPVLEAVLVVTSLLILPMSNPILTPDTWLRYTAALHLRAAASKTETMANGVLPQFYADRFGWQEEVDQISRVYRGLSPEDQQKVVIVCTNYGEASAVNFLGRGLPPAVSGHNSFWIWGPGSKPAEIAILVEDSTPEHLRKFYGNVQRVGSLNHRYAMPYEQRTGIFLMREPKRTLQSLWDSKKDFI